MSIRDWFRKTRDEGWRPMSSAPKDGTVIEIKCEFGMNPWYAKYKYTSNNYFGWAWQNAEDASFFLMSEAEAHSSWRPIK